MFYTLHSEQHLHQTWWIQIGNTVGYPAALETLPQLVVNAPTYQ
jgi:hypothetical protein